jgi:hypothetical protein
MMIIKLIFTSDNFIFINFVENINITKRHSMNISTLVFINIIKFNYKNEL